MLNFNDYWSKYAKGLGFAKAAKMYFYYLEASTASSDFAEKDMKINKTVTIDHVIQAKAFLQLAPLNYPCPQDCPQVCQEPCQKPKGNNPMYIENDKHIESNKINHAAQRIDSAFYNKSSTLSKLFGLDDMDAPATTQEFIDRITTGKFMFKNPEKKDTKGFFYRQTENIRWRDPAVKEDNVGYDAAVKSLEALRTAAQDTLIFGSLADTQTAIKAIDAWTPTATQ